MMVLDQEVEPDAPATNPEAVLPHFGSLTELLHHRFVWMLASAPSPRRYTDGGPADRNRSRKRRAGKRQRIGRKTNR